MPQPDNSSAEIDPSPNWRSPGQFSLPSFVRNHWFLGLGFAAIAVPTMLNLADEYWSTEAGSHSPIVLVTSMWLLGHIRQELRKTAGPPLPMWAIGACLLALIPAFVLGSALDLLFISSIAVYGFFLVIAARFIGVGGIYRNMFPFAYFVFLIPIPGWALDMVTVPLRHWISSSATWLLALLGYPVGQEGVVIHIAQYQLLVEDACSGMNSIVGLAAISMFYIYMLHRARWIHVALLLLAILPIAIFANLIRVLILILITYYGGDAMAQGFLHNFAGITLFAFALGIMVGVDLLIRSIIPQRKSPAPSSGNGE